MAATNKTARAASAPAERRLAGRPRRLRTSPPAGTPSLSPGGGLLGRTTTRWGATGVGARRSQAVAAWHRTRPREHGGARRGHAPSKASLHRQAAVAAEPARSMALVQGPNEFGARPHFGAPTQGRSAACSAGSGSTWAPQGRGFSASASLRSIQKISSGSGAGSNGVGARLWRGFCGRCRGPQRQVRGEALAPAPRSRGWSAFSGAGGASTAVGAGSSAGAPLLPKAAARSSRRSASSAPLRRTRGPPRGFPSGASFDTEGLQPPVVGGSLKDFGRKRGAA